MSLWRYLTRGPQGVVLTPLDVYRKILTHEDGLPRGHRLTQPGQPRKARQWPTRARRYHATVNLVEFDSRFREAS